jgi:hypothetical protein
MCIIKPLSIQDIAYELTVFVPILIRTFSYIDMYTVCTVRIIIGYCIQFPGGQVLFLFSKGSRPVLRPTQPPIQWVPGASSPGIKRQKRQADHSSPSSAMIKNYGAIPPLCRSQWPRGLRHEVSSLARMLGS